MFFKSKNDETPVNLTVSYMDGKEESFLDVTLRPLGYSDFLVVDHADGAETAIRKITIQKIHVMRLAAK